MRKKLSKGLIVLLAFVMVFAVTDMRVYAADAVNVDISSVSTTVGGEVEVTISLNGNKEAIAMVDMWVTYDSTVLEAVSGYDQGGGGKVRILSFSGESTYTLKFKGLAAGTSSVGLDLERSIISSVATDSVEKYLNAGTVTVKGAVNLSKNNNLSALTISPGTLTPAFSKDVTTYNITLTESCTRLTVSATPEDSKAKISVWGAAMDPGDNTTKITVTAENGDAKVYTIYTKVPEAPKQEETPLIIDINGTLYNVISNFDEELLPEGYEAADYTYNNKKIVVGKGLSNGKIIFCVSDASVEKADSQFVVYDERTGSFSQLKIIMTKGLSYTVIDVVEVNSVEIPEGFVESEYTLNNMTYNVWVDGNNPAAQYFIIYCTNINGESGWYQYDITEGTMQRAFLNGFTGTEQNPEKPEVTETEPDTAENQEEGLEIKDLRTEYDNYVKKTRLALGLMAFLLVAVVIIVVIFTVKSFRDSHGEYEDEYDEENDDYSEEKPQKEKKVKKSDDDDDFTFIG